MIRIPSDQVLTTWSRRMNKIYVNFLSKFYLSILKRLDQRLVHVDLDSTVDLEYGNSHKLPHLISCPTLDYIYYDSPSSTNYTVINMRLIGCYCIVATRKLSQRWGNF